MSDDAESRRLRVATTDADGRPVRAAALAAWLRVVAPVRARGAVTIAFVSDAAMRRLNRQFAGKDRATDVLSFPSVDRGSEDPRYTGAHPGGPRHTGAHPGDPRHTGAHPGDPRDTGAHPGGPSDTSAHPGNPRHTRWSGRDIGPFLGDIVIATGVARRQARAAGHPYARELRVLALHGLLHLLGYDHETDGGTMARVEARLRRKGGLAAGVIERAATS